MKREDFRYQSADGKNSIHAIRWLPDTAEIKGVIQFIHGMSGHAGRYEAFAARFCEKGYAVTGHDQLGHGLSAKTSDDLGYFADEDGNKCLLSDIESLRKITAELYPGKPYFLMGYSMGSFLARQYIVHSGDKLTGLILTGTGSYSPFSTRFGMSLCKTIAAFKGWRHRSKLLNNIVFAGHNRYFGARGGFDWFTRDTKAVLAFEKDPLCGFCFTLNGFYNLFLSINLLSNYDYIRSTPKELPILILGGGEDPVGHFGKAPAAICERLRYIGMKDVTCKLYPDDRHDIFAELDKDTVYDDVFCWIDK